MKIDCRPRCKRCNKIPRGKLNLENYKRYTPYCGFHCQEWGKLEDAARYLDEKRRAENRYEN